MNTKPAFKVMLKTKKGVITRNSNIHNESNSVDIYYLHNFKKEFINKDINFNTLKDQLITL